MNIMLKMTKRDISRNWLQYVSMIVINFLAVTLFCGFISNTITLQKTVRDFYNESNLSDLIVQMKTITQDDKDYFNSLGVTHEYRIYMEGFFNQKNAKVYSGNNTISKPVITKGEPGVLIDNLNAENASIKIGDPITIVLPSITLDSLVVTGFMNFAECSNVMSYLPVYVDEAILSNYFPVNNLYNQVLIKTINPSNIKNEIINHYQKDINYLFTYDHDSIEAIVALNNEIKQSTKMMSVFPVIFLLVSILVIMTTISPLIMKERTNIGTLKALGIPNKKILMHYSSYGAVICFIGGVLGAITGPQIVPNVLMIKYKLLYCIPFLSSALYSLPWSLFFILAGTLLAFIISVVISLSVIKEKPAQCMRPLPPKSNPLLNKTISKDTNKKIALKMAIRNILVKPSRALMTIAGVLGCVALLVCSFGIGDTVDNSLNLELSKQFKYDVSSGLALNNKDSFIIELEKMKQENKIEEYELYQIFFATAKGQKVKDIKIYEINANSIFTTINPYNKTIISTSIAQDLKVKIGDEVTITISSDIYKLTIDEIIDTAYTKGIFISNNLFDNYNHTLEVWIKTNNGNDIVNDLNKINGTKNAITIEKLRDNINQKISSIKTIRLTLMIFAIALSVVVLYNLSLLNIKERYRDLATLKVLGFSNKEISLSLLLEIIILVIIGTVIGLFLGFPLNYLVMSINKVDVIAFIYHIKFTSYLITAAISILTALIINLFFSKLIKQIKMVESLKSVE